MLEVMSAWNEAGYSTIPVVPPQRPEGKERKLEMPGWKETCEPLQKDAKFWYALWLSAG